MAKQSAWQRVTRPECRLAIGTSHKRGVASAAPRRLPLSALPSLPPASPSLPLLPGRESLPAAPGLQCAGLKGVIWFLTGTGNFDVSRALLYLGCKFIWGARRDLQRWGAALKSPQSHLTSLLPVVPLLSFPLRAPSRSQPLIPNLPPPLPRALLLPCRLPPGPQPGRIRLGPILGAASVFSIDFYLLPSSLAPRHEEPVSSWKRPQFPLLGQSAGGRCVGPLRPPRKPGGPTPAHHADC